MVIWLISMLIGIAMSVYLTMSLVPYGYEDDDGFHYGEPDDNS